MSAVADFWGMPVIAFANLKGGVAKTTNAVAVARTLAGRGLRVLVIDADHQCTASELLLGEDRMLQVESDHQTLHDLFRDMLRPDFDGNFDCYVESDRDGLFGEVSGISVLACSVRIEDLQTNVARARRGVLTGPEFLRLWGKRRVAFRRWLRETFDVTIIDCPPSLTRHVEFLLRISDGIVVPAVPDRLSLRGALQFVKRLEDKGIDTPFLGTLWTLFRTQVDTHREIVMRARRSEDRVGNGTLPIPFRTVIPNAAAIAAAGEPTRTGLRGGTGFPPTFAAMYATLCDELQSRSGGSLTR